MHEKKETVEIRGSGRKWNPAASGQAAPAANDFDLAVVDDRLPRQNQYAQKNEHVVHDGDSHGPLLAKGGSGSMSKAASLF